MNIAEVIPYGSENAVTRESLELTCGMSDRQVRQAIARARRDVVILNLSDGRGYYRPTADEKTEAMHYVLQERSRAMEILRGLQPAEEFINE